MCMLFTDFMQLYSFKRVLRERYKHLEVVIAFLPLPASWQEGGSREFVLGGSDKELQMGCKSYYYCDVWVMYFRMEAT